MSSKRAPSYTIQRWLRESREDSPWTGCEDRIAWARCEKVEPNEARPLLGRRTGSTLSGESSGTDRGATPAVSIYFRVIRND